MSGDRGAKELLAEALKDQLQVMALSKVTVTGLTKQVGLTRQAFYYHFVDVYDLAVWVFETEVADHIMSHASYDRWAEGYQQLLTYMREHRTGVYAVIHSLGHHELERFLYGQFHQMMEAIVAELRGDLTVSAADQERVISHFALVVLGYCMYWLASDMEADPSELVPEIEFLLQGQVRHALETYAARA